MKKDRLDYIFGERRGFVGDDGDLGVGECGLVDFEFFTQDEDEVGRGFFEGLEAAVEVVGAPIAEYFDVCLGMGGADGGGEVGYPDGLWGKLEDGGRFRDLDFGGEFPYALYEAHGVFRDALDDLDVRWREVVRFELPELRFAGTVRVHFSGCSPVFKFKERSEEAREIDAVFLGLGKDGGRAVDLELPGCIGDRFDLKQEVEKSQVPEKTAQ